MQNSGVTTPPAPSISDFKSHSCGDTTQRLEKWQRTPPVVQKEKESVGGRDGKEIISSTTH